MNDALGSIRIGTSGWSYPSGGGSWNGTFYPTARAGAQRAATGRFDELAYYAEHFDTVEVNSSFYRPPVSQVTRSWTRRTPAGFEFSLKLYQKFTHPEMFKLSAGGGNSSVVPADIDGFKRGIDPLATAGKLGALLAQFPASFTCTDEARDHLRGLLQAFHDYSLAVELRHRSWSDEKRSTLELLGEFGAAWTWIDEPKFRSSVRQDFVPNVTGLYYMRLHGRNADKWWTHDSTEERYNYLYSWAELEPFGEAARLVRQRVRKLYVYLNNHFAAQAVANAVMLKHQLGQPPTGNYPPAFVERYPSLKEIVSTIPGPATLV